MEMYDLWNRVISAVAELLVNEVVERSSFISVSRFQARSAATEHAVTDLPVIPSRSWCTIQYLLLRPGRGAEYCDQFVCLRVLLFASISSQPLYRSSRIFCADPCGRGSILLWRRCDMLCTSGFMDDVMFGRSGRMAMRGRLNL